MNSDTRREVETTNPQGVVERWVETVNYVSSAGQGQQVKSVEVVHQPHPQEESQHQWWCLGGCRCRRGIHSPICQGSDLEINTKCLTFPCDCRFGC
ncbi:hypothetical protein Patl1_19166 [Pistacia atlantica]|uniref:Uncharacterized protein n=1 Tax=Pistacia atlantica TaxID=434234 RepID=A0ACC1C1D1_9ROSI|nr:hypothetical protein Patl1_19166 [Pistacia atlantica]